MKIGIVGAENTHAAIIARALNVEKRIPGVRVAYLWGETPEFAMQTAEEGAIENIVETPEAMIGNIDGVVINHRHGKYHLEAATPFLQKGVPLFVDKPLCCDPEEGRRFLSLARQRKVPVTSYSILPLQETFLHFQEAMQKIGPIKAATSCGPCDTESPYGGIFFYGIHQIEMILSLFGYDVKTVQMIKHGENASASLLYPDGKIVTVNFIKEEFNDFHLTAIGTKEALHEKISFDTIPHLESIKRFVNMFQTGKEPVEHSKILRPIEVLSALENY